MSLGNTHFYNRFSIPQVAGFFVSGCQLIWPKGGHNETNKNLIFQAYT